MNDKIFGLTGLIEFFRELDKTRVYEVGGRDIGFAMDWEKPDDNPCGSACCIGGWIDLLRPDIGEMEIEGVGRLSARVILLAREEGLSVSHHDAFRLCYPDSPTGAYEATPAQAAIALEAIKEGLSGHKAWVRAMGLE